MTSRLLPAVLLAMLLAACGKDASNPAPPRVSAPTAIPAQASTIIIPISAELADLEKLLNAEVPTELVSIDREEKACVPAQQIKGCAIPKIVCEKGLKCRKVGCEVDIKATRVTPDISCRIVGAVNRGPITLTGVGDHIRLVMPVAAKVSAKDIGNVIKSETATAAAEVRADIRLDIIGDWQPVAKVTIDYDWTEKPGIEMFGRRLTFAGKADPALARIIAKIEADIPKHIAKLQPREQLERGWGKGFTAISLNARNPPVWLRITPQQLRYDGYSVEDGALTLNLAARAATETFIGDRPADPPRTPLPPPGRITGEPGFRFHLPVIADYAELEPVLEKALGKLSKKRIELPAIGAVTPNFGKVTIYATENGRLAIGLAMSVSTPGKWIDAKGTVWATGIPHNEPGSQRITVRYLTIDGRADTPAFQLLLAVAQSPAVMDELKGGLSQDFAKDYAKVMLAAENALKQQNLGDFVLSARIDNVRNGTVFPAGQGLYMPVDATGIGAMRYVPGSKAVADAERARRRAEKARLEAEKAIAGSAAP